MELLNLIKLLTSDTMSLTISWACPVTVVFHVPPRDLAEDGETCQTWANGFSFAQRAFFCSRVQAGMHEQFHWSKAKFSSNSTTYHPKTKKQFTNKKTTWEVTSLEYWIFMQNTLSFSSSNASSHDMVFWGKALQENTLKLFKVCACGVGWRV